jgi:hypothetical protein
LDSAATSDFSLGWSEAGSDFVGPDPFDTLTEAGLRSRSLRRKPRCTSSETIPALNLSDSSLETASCTFQQQQKINK